MSAAPAGAATTHTTDVQHSAAADAAGQEKLPKLLADVRTAAAQGHRAKPASTSKTRTYTVKEGDTLSAIAQHYYSESAAWPVIYYANRHSIKSANEISVGQKLAIPAKPAKIPAAPPTPAPAPVSRVSTASAAPAQVTTEAQPAATTQPATTQPAATYSGSGSFQSCVIAAESGGNSQVMNGSGHYGLYQFSESTWEEYGGSASTFGNASVSEQNQVFDNAIAQGGQSNWSAYDGC